MWHTSSFAVAQIAATVLLLAGGSTAIANIPDSLSSWLEANPVPTQLAGTTRITASNRTLSRSQINAQRNRCPNTCDNAGFNPNNWTVYHDVNRLESCDQPMILNFALYNSLDNPLTHASIQSCVAEYAADTTTATASCPLRGNSTQVQESIQIAFNKSATTGSLDDFTTASQQLQRYLTHKESDCGETITFAYSGSAVVGIYAGSGVQNISTSVLADFITEVQSAGISESVLVQLCSGTNRSSRYSLGIIANADADLAFVQNAVGTWASGNCVTSYDSSETWQNITLSLPTSYSNATFLSAKATSTNAANSTFVARYLAPRASASSTAECTTVEIVADDTCATLATECGITAAEFTDYNPSSTLCSSLVAGGHVCCSEGTLPDYSPSAYTNGTCYTYLVVSGDSCSALAASYSLTEDIIESYNNNTWGWMGCDDLQAGQNMCLSSGSAPMPAVLANAVCGPQVPGTITVPSGTNLSLLNGCPMNACCDIWGQCGITDEFCTITESPTGAPGTAAKGTNGCISNCGTSIIVGDAPDNYINVGFFEGFNTDRPCLNSPLSSLDLSSYTHIVMSFAVITDDFDIDISSIQSSFDDFISLTGFKKIISIGGWSFSTDPSTYDLFREAVTPTNMVTFAENIAAFLTEYDLDGVNIDWEYPGEPDIPGIPAGTTDDGAYYAIFLDELSVKVSSGMEISVCAPSSFWYLQGFLIEAMSDMIDYVVFMTYDLHGQWDYGHNYSDPGCPYEGCLRSHVNLTETISALSMITKAGVASSKVIIGVSSYGRSFQMAEAGCYTENCAITGPDSGAYAGTCTETPGYIGNAEINGIIYTNGSVLSASGESIAITTTPLTYLDNISYSNIVVYEDTQWIGYMDDENKAARKILYEAYNLGGVADWAIDLQSYTGDTSNGTSSTVINISPDLWTDDNPSLACEPPCILVLPPYPLGFTSTVTWPLLTTTLLSLSGTATVTITTTITVPSFQITDISMQPITVSATETSTYVISPVQSITPSSFIWTLGPNEATIPPTAIPTQTATTGDEDEDGASSSSSTLASSTSSSTSSSKSSSTSSATTVIGLSASITFYTTSFPVTIQPQATYSISLPPTLAYPSYTDSIISTSTATEGGSSTNAASTNAASTNAAGTTAAAKTSKPIPVVTVSKGKPKHTSSSSSSHRHCHIFGCKPDCGLFACDGGCVIFGCGGGCGVLGCAPDCPLETCGGLSCTSGKCGTDAGSNGSSGTEPESEDCDEPSTVSACTYIVSSFSTSPMTTYSTTTKTHCETFVECSTEDSATTTTVTTSEPAPTATVTVAGWEPPWPTETSADLSSLASSIRSARSVLDKVRYSGLTSSSTSSSTTSLSTITITVTASSVSIPPSTTTSVVIVTPTAVCDYYDEGWGWTFKLTDIEYWSTDGGAALKKQEDGCGDVTGWRYTNATSSEVAHASWNIDFFIKSGCAERAIVSAGGPSISCKGHSLDLRDLSAVTNSTDPAGPPNYSAEEIAEFKAAYANATTYIPYVPMDWSGISNATSTAAGTTSVAPSASAAASSLAAAAAAAQYKNEAVVYVYVYVDADESS
ncbi:hypothetical protein NHQ30_007897 [Ciborinia camelliae]|nr:hypothetical protein NHQ30_007897 [Ciborinia camelliae]